MQYSSSIKVLNYIKFFAFVVLGTCLLGYAVATDPPMLLLTGAFVAIGILIVALWIERDAKINDLRNKVESLIQNTIVLNQVNNHVNGGQDGSQHNNSL